MQLGSVGSENATDEQEKRLIWLDRAVVDRLRSLRGPGESYSSVIESPPALQATDKGALQ